uniref:Two pore segment channel 2 n=1 Tax=Mastacembelus armatus TaxID=205130 RepID=A0A7N8X9T3_9TELE
MQNSSLMKKTLKCIKRTLPEIARYLTPLYRQACLGSTASLLLTLFNINHKCGKWELHFRNLPNSLTSLLVLLTTANNPDVMIPAYSLNRGYSIFFVAFSVIGTYCLMNLLTAIIYNQFRGYLLMSVQTSIIRRRLGIRAAFQVLSCLGPGEATEAVNQNFLLVYCNSFLLYCSCQEVQHYADVGYMDCEQFRKIFDELDKDRIKEHPPLPQYSSPVLQRLQVIFSHYYLTVLGNAVALANVICICTVLVLNSEKSTTERDNYVLEIINLCFILYYLLEMSVKIFAFSWRGYLSYRNNIFDGFLTILLLYYTFPHNTKLCNTSLCSLCFFWSFIHFILFFQLMALVASTLLDLVKNLRAFAGILVVVYYVFAVFGIWLFEGAIKPPPEMSSMENITSNFSMECGTYEQLGYWPNNFDDFAASIILLYDVMIVNNWQAFMEAYSRYTTSWAKIYFVCWWFTSSVMWVNLFVALILENFIYKWDRSHKCSVTDVERIRYETSVQLIFKGQIQEPTEEELLCQLHQHPHLHLHW